MSDVECEYCGESFDERGLGAHQAHCDGARESPSDSEPASRDTATGQEKVTSPEPNFGELESIVHERDEGCCVRCASDSSLVIHQVNPTVGHEKANLVTLCADCDVELEGLHYRTKRTKIHSEK